ncbi:unnamed protein product [Linum tenue]|nr:unnamed protein product [Linum tenue]
MKRCPLPPKGSLQCRNHLDEQPCRRREAHCWASDHNEQLGFRRGREDSVARMPHRLRCRAFE